MDIEAFEKNYSDAKGYHLRAIQFAEEGRRASLVFNVASVAIEDYLLALCSYHGVMPFNHNYTCLMDAAERVVTFDPDLRNNIRSLDEIFGICSVENYHHGIPTPGDSLRTLSMCSELTELIGKLNIEILKSESN
jgi:hypothetical protein